MLILWGFAALIGQPTGQIAKFDSRPPEAEYVSRARLEEIERCLIRLGSPPAVYRQPDRPDEVMLVWTAGGVSAGNAAGRVDLRRSGDRTIVKSWLSAKAVRECGPAG